MTPRAPHYRSGSINFARLVTGTLAALGAVFTAVVWPSAQAPAPAMDLVVGRNVNMVSGQTLPNGDPYLQRQNEPSVAASTRNPLHLLAGANDYRTVDIPGNFDDGETGDAWLGVFKSLDGGERWQSTLLPGYPQDTSPEGMASPLKAYHAGADPVVRPGTNGLLYYAGLAFNRGAGGASAIFVSRFVDNNNKENGDPIAYISTSLVASSTGAAFLDKPWLAVDVPRAGAKVCRINTQQAAPQLTAGARDQLAKRGKGADGRLVSAAAQTIKTTRTTKGTPTVLPTPGITKATTVSQQVLAGTMYVAYAQITTTVLATGASDIESRIMFSRSDDCGATWSKPVRISDPLHKVNQGATIAVDPSTGVVHVAWRQFGLTATAPDAIMTVTPDISAKVSKKPVKVHEFKPGPKADAIQPKLQRAHRHGDVNQLVSIRPFDSGTGEDRFRTNAYPTIAIDDESRVYLAWTERGYAGARSDPLIGDARVVLATSRTPGVWTAPRAVDSATDGTDLPGHQMMPSMSYSGGRLLIVYYDLRQDVSQVFGPFVSEADAISSTNRRHTIDVRAVQAPKGDVPAFGMSTLVSQYLMGNLRGTTGGSAQQLQFNAPNLPLFQLGTVPFMGDYIDVAPAPAFVQNPGGAWVHNTATTSAPVFHAVWTDNRDVQKPKDGNWQNYTPPGGGGCIDGQTGMRNQNVYSARITMGLLAGSPGNSKPLSTTTPRGFVVFAQNLTYQTKAFRLTITNQPVGGSASFDQLGLATPAPLLLTVDVKVAPRSMVTRTVYATSSNAREQVRVSIAEVGPQDFLPVAGGLATTVVLNPDISNPDISNPDISNPDISNPDISNAEVYNPDISNPDISNPDISNPDISNPDISNPDISNVRIANPDISNPDISNPDISNPDISNPDISNPDISNPDISNGSLTDVTWTIKNDGNTTASFNVNLFLANQAAAAGGIKTQLVVHKTYKTPVSDGCVLKSQTQTVLVANVLNPTFKTAGADTTFDPANPDISNTTLWLEPGGEGKITLRIVDPDPTDAIEINPVTDVTPVVQSLAVNTPQLDEPAPVPPATPLPTDPVPAPVVSLAFVAQPVNTLVGVAMPNITVAAVEGAVPAAGVQVTLAIAINPSGGNLVGTVTTLTDALGVATFPGLSINKDGVNYRLSASASAAGALPVLSVPFTIGAAAPPPPPPVTGWAASGDGIVTLLDNGAVGGTPRMSYQRNGFPNFNGAWTMSSLASGAGAVRLDWEWTGFHSWCQASVQLQAFVNRGGLDVFTAPLLQETDNCVGARNPSAGFAFAGSTSVAVQIGDTYGFRLAGSHFDGTYVMEGTFGVLVNGATSASPFVVTNASDVGPGSLRAAMLAANAAPDVNTISFAIPGAWVHTIAPATPLPVVSTPMVINGLSQPGSALLAPKINIDGRYLQGQISNGPLYTADDQPGTNIGLAPGFEVVSSDVAIRGVGINRFPGPGVYINTGASAVQVEDNLIGVHPATGLMTSPNSATGVEARYTSGLVIARNVISGSQFSGIGLTGGTGTQITGNRIGTSANGLVAAPNGDNGITMYDGANNTTIDGNLISGNGTVGAGNGFGIDIQQSGALADVTNTVITNNVIGLNANGDLLGRGGGDYIGSDAINYGNVSRGNAGGGVRVHRGSGTQIGQAGAGNTISGNTTHGVVVTGPVSTPVTIRANRIGTNLDGTAGRGNGRTGVVADAVATRVGGSGAGEGNTISANLGDGLTIGATGVIVQGNRIGTNTAGAAAIGNGPQLVPADVGLRTGITVNGVSDVVIGGAAPGARNIISGNRTGIIVFWGNTNLEIRNNFIGTDSSGNNAIANGANGQGEGGIALYGGTGAQIVGNRISFNTGSGGGIFTGTGPQNGLIEDNTISNNTGRGIVLRGGPANAEPIASMRIRSNRIFGNTDLGIDLDGDGANADDAGDSDAGSNGRQNFGTLSNVNVVGPTTAVDIAVDTDTPNVNYEIQVFASTACHASGFGEGQRLVGTFIRSSDGAADIATTLSLTEAVPTGQSLTATVTQLGSGQTSEFSQCVTVPAPPAPPVPPDPGAPDGSAGGGGGTPFGPITCPAGAVGAGLRGSAGDDIDSTQLWCRTVQPGPSLGGEVFAGGVGFGGASYGDALMCPAGSVLIGVHGRAGQVLWGGNVVDTIGTTCRNVVTGAVTQSVTVGNPSPLTTAFTIGCPAGEEVTAIGGGQGSLLDRIEIYCNNAAQPVSAPQATSGTLEQVFDGPHHSVAGQVVEEHGRRLTFAREAAIEFRRRFRVGA